jgi:ubiquinone/menaquinone biosynthesis C-methylase UbiE
LIDNLVNSKKFNSTEYKKRLIKTWNEVAPRYHKRWAKNCIGPFKSTEKLVTMAQIRNDYHVLDLACGTGLVTKQILKKIGKGHIVGIDSSQTAIKIAKRWNKKKNVDFVVADAERINFSKKFDAITCQYALFFFPNAPVVLKNLKQCLKKNGILAVSVHGSKKSVPYFSSTLDVVTKFIPDYLPPGAPSLDRFGTKTSLKKALASAGFAHIKVKQYCFEHNAGTFEKYWNDYLKYLAKPLKEKLSKIPDHKKNIMKEQIMKNTNPYVQKGQIVFPWKVLIATATKL